MCDRNTLRDHLFALNKDHILSDVYGIRVDPDSMRLSVGWCIMSVDGANKPAVCFTEVEFIHISSPWEEKPLLISSRVPGVDDRRFSTITDLLHSMELRKHINYVRPV